MSCIFSRMRVRENCNSIILTPFSSRSRNLLLNGLISDSFIWFWVRFNSTTQQHQVFCPTSVLAVQKEMKIHHEKYRISKHSDIIPLRLAPVFFL